MLGECLNSKRKQWEKLIPINFFYKMWLNFKNLIASLANFAKNCAQIWILPEIFEKNFAKIWILMEEAMNVFIAKFIEIYKPA